MDTNVLEAQAGFRRGGAGEGCTSPLMLQGVGSMKFSFRPSHFLLSLVTAWILMAGIARAETSPVWLMLSANLADSVMTVGANEMESLMKAGWTVEAAGSVQSEPAAGSALLHRMIRSNTRGTDRMLESDPAQVAKLKEAGFVEEGLLGFVMASDAKDRIPIVQFARGDKRLWLVKETSAQAAQAKGWSRQGVQFWLGPPPK